MAIAEATVHEDLQLIRESARDFAEAEIRPHVLDWDERELSIELSTRGRFRFRNCDFPPLMLNFSKKELRGMGLTTPEHDKLKLVTHCLEERFMAKELVAKEALAY
jgi:alkylation response protein AidB-like acyl-CoA dehydrogenase